MGDLCRLCAVKKDNFVGIYDEEGHKLSLETKITKCLQIELCPKDPLPKTVCLDCCTKLNLCSDFFETTTQAQVTLHMIFPGTKKEEELETEEHRPELEHEQDHDSSSFLEEIGIANKTSSQKAMELTEDTEQNHQEFNPLTSDNEEGSVDPGPPVLVECVLSDTKGAGGELKGDASQASDSLPALSSRRKGRVPVRCTQQLQEQQQQQQQDQDLHEQQHIRDRERLRPGRPSSNRKTRRGRSKAAESASRQEQRQQLEQPKQEKQQTEENEVKLELEELEHQQEEQQLLEHEEGKEQEELQDDSSSTRKRRDGWEKYPWMCTDCSQELPSMQALRTHHQKDHNQAPRFMCAQCSKVYTKYYGFVSHVRRHRNHMKFCCEECGKCFSNKKVLESHRATHSDARPFVCSECGKTFRQQSALYVHNRSHQPDDVKNKYPCDQCDKRFSTKPNLVTHKRIHTGIRNFTCDQCGKSFIQKGNLDAHLLTHSSDKPHSCPICNKGFKTPLQLRKHQTVHTGAKPHQCDVCGRQFRERGTLREHHRIHTGAMPFTCEFCGKNFRFKGILTTHRRQHTGERPYSCIECQHHFTNWPNYNKHMKRRHGINTSHQPDPNKIAVAAAAAAAEAVAAASNSSISSVVSATVATHNIYINQGSNPGHDEQHLITRSDRGVQFYNPAPTPSYTAAPIPAGTMLGFYNIPQLQQSMDTTTIEMLHSVQQR